MKDNFKIVLVVGILAFGLSVMIFEAESPLCGPRIGFLNSNNDILNCGKGQILLLSGVVVSIFLFRRYPYHFYSDYFRFKRK